MRLLLLFSLIVFIQISQIFAQTRPDKIEGLQLWLRADSNVILNGSAVSDWNDCSGNMNNAIQTSHDNQPILKDNCIAGLPAIIFNGNISKQYLLTPKGLFNGYTSITLFFVIKLIDGKTNSGIFGSNLDYTNLEFIANTNGTISVNGGSQVNNILTPLDYWHIVSINFSSKISIWKDGINIEDNSGNSFPIAQNIQQAIGRYASNYGNFYGNFSIAEMILYNNSLSNKNKFEIENYLKNKYVNYVKLDSNIIVKTSLCDTTIHAGTGFASYKWSTGATTESIKAGKGIYTVTVTDASGFTSSDSTTISYEGTKLISQHQIICQNDSYSLQTSIQPNNYSYKWNTGFVGKSLNVNSAGNYYATVSDQNGCYQMTDTAIVLIDNFNTSASLANDTNLCSGNTLGFTNKILPKNIIYQWNTNATTATIPVTTTGNYSVTATDENGCIATDTIAIKVIGIAPNADFSYYLSNQNNNTIQFTNTSPLAGTQILWNFDDGNTSTIVNPTHSYVIGGLYVVTLQLSDGTCSNSSTKNIYISPIQKSGLMLWLRADSNVTVKGSNVSSWNDCSGTGNNVLQSTDSYKPIMAVNAVNNHPAIRFDGIDDYLNGGDMCDITSSGISIFVVSKGTGLVYAKSTASGIWQGISLNCAKSALEWQYIDNAPREINVSKPVDVFAIYTQIANKPSVTVSGYINSKLAGKMEISSSFNMNSKFDFLLGAYNNSLGTVPPNPGSFLNGDIAEIIIYDKPLGDQDRKKVENYLHSKYGPLPVDLGLDIITDNKLCDTIIHAGTRFTKYVWSTGDTTESIKVKKSGIYVVNVTDYFGYESSDNIKVTFNAEPHLIPDTTICPKASLTWDTKLNTTDFSFKWSTGETTSSIIIKNAGDYILTVNDKYGCSYISDTVTVKIDDFDKSIDLGNDTTLCKNNELELVKGADRAVQYSWSDGSHNKTMILVSGDKYYYVTATDKYTCSANDSIKVKVQGIAPITPFTMTGHCQNNQISLKDNSVLSDNTTKIIAYKWIIESDTLLTKDTSYLFKKAGLYYIKHIAITDGACSGSKTLPITIDPIPSISFIPKSVCQYSPVNFINTSSFNTSNSESIIWNIKGTKVEGKDTITYKFNSYGTTDVSLTITTNDNCTDSLVEKVEVKFSPKAIFSNSPACELNDYFLFDNSTSPTAYGLTTRMWYINNLITQDQTVHLLPDSTQIGDNVLLKVTGVNGCFDTVSRFIPYSPIPKAALEFKKSCVGDITTFNDKSTVASGSIVKWKWNIGNDIESYEQNPSVIFTESKTYPITLHITSDKGCEDTIVSQTKVIKKPIAGFDYNPKIAGAPIDISFTNTSDSATSYKWTFGDSESSTLFEPIHEYSDSGKYTVSLYAYNDYMCVDSSKKTINLQKANYKIELYSITSTDKNGYVTVSTVFINAGLNPLTNIDFILTKDDGTNVKETWKGLNTTGVIDTFTFASKFKISNGTELPKYICIDAKVIGKQDSIVAANSKCITSLKEFTFLSAYPIPANDNLTFTFVSPEKGNAQYAIYSSIGQIIMENSVAIVEGINKLTIPTHTLIEGYYIWKLNVAGKEKTGKLLISRNSK